MNDKAAYAKRAVKLKKIKRFKARLLKFETCLHDVLSEIEQLEYSNFNDKQLK